MRSFQNAYSGTPIPLSCFAILFSFLYGLLLFVPIALAGNAKYFSFFYPVIGFYCFIHIKDKRTILKENRLLIFFLIYHVFLLFIHINDSASVVNLGALFTGYSGLYLMLIYFKTTIGLQKTEKLFFYSVVMISVISIPISTILTYLNWPTAPSYYPWESIVGSYRFILISGHGVGHSAQMWLMAFAILYIIHNMASTKKIKFWAIVLSIIYIYLLIQTKSRMGLAFASIILCMPLAYLFNRTMVVVFYGVIATLLLIYIGSVNLNFKNEVINTAYVIQEIFPYQRILGSERPDSYFFTGRDILNQALFSYSFDNAFFGLGDGHPIFDFGVDKDGNIPLFDWQKIASSESALNLAAKYGYPYLLFVFVLVAKPLFNTMRSKNKDNILAFFVLCIIMITFSGSGLFLNLYGINGIFMFLILLYTLKCPLPKIEKIKKID